MLTITILGKEYFDDVTKEFVTLGDVTFEIEHSLASLSKWESIFHKPFLATEDKTSDEVLGYIEAMCLTPDIAPEVFLTLTEDNVSEINAYIDNKMSATWFADELGIGRSREIITSELIYYWLITFQIPFSCETWHLNRLLTLIKVCNLKQQKPKKMSPAQVAARNRALNDQRRARSGSNG